MWENVPEIDENGVLIAFEILYIPLETFNGILVQKLVNTSASNRTVTLNNLEEYIFYNILVRAYTSVGAGPFSPFITQRTSEDSKFFFIYNSIKLLYNVIYHNYCGNSVTITVMYNC